MTEDKLKSLAKLRRKPLIEEVGYITEQLSEILIEYAEANRGGVRNSIESRYSKMNTDQSELSLDISRFYDQVRISDSKLLEIVKSELGIPVTDLRIGVLDSGCSLDWHMDYEDKLRIHVDLNMDSEFLFKIREVEQAEKKKRLFVYKINASHYHKVINDSEYKKYALIGTSLV